MFSRAALVFSVLCLFSCATRLPPVAPPRPLPAPIGEALSGRQHCSTEPGAGLVEVVFQPPVPGGYRIMTLSIEGNRFRWYTTCEVMVTNTSESVHIFLPRAPPAFNTISLAHWEMRCGSSECFWEGVPIRISLRIDGTPAPDPECGYAHCFYSTP